MTPRLLISYSHDSPAHASRVLALADQLRTDGLDVHLDQYDPHPQEGWPRWMATQLREADFVLLVCTPTYHRRFIGEERPGTGRGVTWEGLLAQQQLYEANSINTKLIPVLFDDEPEDSIPLVLRPFAHYRLDANYDDLYRHLTDQPKHTPAPLGTVKKMAPAPRPRLFGSEEPDEG